MKFEQGWYGTIGFTQDNLPKLVKLDDNVIALYGYNGRGIGPGTVFGRAIADFLLTNDSGVLPLSFTQPRPERLRRLRAACFHLGVNTYHFLKYRF